MGKFVWFNPNDPNDKPDSNCMVMIYNGGYKALGVACDRDGRNHFPICQIK